MARPARMQRGSGEEAEQSDGMSIARPSRSITGSAPVLIRDGALHAESDGAVHPGLQQITRLLARQAALRHRRRSLGCSVIEFPFALAIVALLLMACLFLASHLMGP